MPDGTAVVGNTISRETLNDISLMSAAPQVLVEDISWLRVGDIDEVFLWTEDPAGKAACLLFSADVLEGKKLLSAKNIQKAKTEFVDQKKEMYLHFAKISGFSLSDDFMSRPKNASDLRSKKEIEEGAGDLGLQLSEEGQRGIELIQQKIDLAAEDILAAPGTKHCRRIRIPLLFKVTDEENEKNCSKGECQYSPVFQNQISSLVLKNKVYSFRPNFSVQRKIQEKIFQENGFTANWYEKQGANAMAGGMHCSSSTLRAYRLE